MLPVVSLSLGCFSAELQDKSDVVERIWESLDRGALLACNSESIDILKENTNDGKVLHKFVAMLDYAKKFRKSPFPTISPFVVENQDLSEFEGIDIAIVDTTEITPFREWHQLPYTGIINVTYNCIKCNHEWVVMNENPDEIPDCNDCGSSANHISGCDESNRLCSQLKCEKVVIKKTHCTNVETFDGITSTFYHRSTNFIQGEHITVGLRKSMSTPLMWSSRIELWDGYMLQSGYKRRDEIRPGICRFLELLKEARETIGTPLKRLRIAALPLTFNSGDKGEDILIEYLESLITKNQINGQIVSRIEVVFFYKGMGQRYIVFEKDHSRFLYEPGRKGLTEALQSKRNSDILMKSSRWTGPLENEVWDSCSRRFRSNEPYRVITFD